MERCHILQFQVIGLRCHLLDFIGEVNKFIVFEISEIAIVFFGQMFQFIS